MPDPTPKEILDQWITDTYLPKQAEMKALIDELYQRKETTGEVISGLYPSLRLLKKQNTDEYTAYPYPDPGLQK